MDGNYACRERLKEGLNLQWIPIQVHFAISSDTEQMPISVLEAMAAGCPIVGTDVGDVKEMVSPENRAYIVPRSNEDLFRRMLERLLKDESLRIYLGEQNQIQCRKFFEKKLMFEVYEKVYDMRL